MVSLSPRKLVIVPSRDSVKSAGLKKDKLDNIRQQMLGEFRTNNYDQGLLVGVREIISLSSHTSPNSQGAYNNTNFQSDSSTSLLEYSFPWKYLFIIIFIFFAFRILQRFLSNRRSTQLSNQFSSQPNNPSYGGFGGSGILQGILGGIAATVAGRWLYDKVFNTSAHASDQGAENMNNNSEHSGASDQGQQEIVFLRVQLISVICRVIFLETTGYQALVMIAVLGGDDGGDMGGDW